ncbi:MAG: GNAT family N-acetyltransferase [Casimicrobiaceae bacterium]
MTSAAFSVRLTDWTRDSNALRAIREPVFIVEQQVPAALEWDAADHVCVHALALDADGRPIGCARLLDDAHIGRVAVLQPWRGRGVGNALMAPLIEMAHARGYPRVMLHAQVRACGFYARMGFEAEGGVFEEAGIAHQSMALAL